MAGLDNLIELIRTTNEVYFITAPERVRAAYILVDDIVELALKTYLQTYTLEKQAFCQQDLENNPPVLVRTPQHQNQLTRYFNGTIDENELAITLGQNGAVAIANLQARLAQYQNLQHWSLNQPEARKSFDDIVQEVEALNQGRQPVLDLLNEAIQRHTNRNRMYHDHQHVGWVISDIRCLQSICDLFQLLEFLFPGFIQVLHLTKHNTVRAQIGILRLKLQAEEGMHDVAKPYNDALDQLKSSHNYTLNPRSIEHSILHTVSDRFFNAVRENFRGEIAKLEVRISQLEEMIADPKRKKSSHPLELADKNQLLGILQQQLTQIDNLMGP